MTSASIQPNPRDEPPLERNAGWYFRWGVVLIAVFLGTILVLKHESVIPDRFIADAAYIQEIAQGTEVIDRKFNAVANIYRVLGLAENSVAAGMLGYLMFLATLATVFISRRIVSPSWPVAGTTAASIILASVYLGQYSKDVWVLPVVALAVLLRPGLASEIGVAIAMLAYAWFMRDYWVVTAAGFIAIWLVSYRVRRAYLPLLGAAMSVMASLAIVIFLGKPADTFRATINAWRDQSDTGSIILPLIDIGEPLSGILNNLSTYVFMFFPAPLALRGGIYYVATALLIATLWGLAAYGLMRAPLTSEARRAASILIAFAATQSLFEPDYGSALRHLTPMLPLIVLLLAPRPRA